jgi:uncharacterized membrane protein YqjE
MATRQRTLAGGDGSRTSQQRTLDGGDGRRTTIQTPPSTEPPMTDLLRQLGTEGAALVRSEVALAKLEMRELGRQLAIDSAKLFAAILLAAVGGLVLAAAAVIALGNALNGQYALSALIIGVALLLIGGLLARGGLGGLKQGHSPEKTVDSLKTTKEWAGDEIREFTEEVRS